MKKHTPLHYVILAVLSVVLLAYSLPIVSAATITANVSETNINSTILLSGTEFLPNTQYYLAFPLENKSAWWDGFNENWFFWNTTTNNTITVTTDAEGNFSYPLYIPNDWRVSGGKVSVKIGERLASGLIWSTQGQNFAATQPTKNGITGDTDENGYVYAVSNAAVINQGGVEKFFKNNGTLACKYNWSVITTANDIANNGSIAYVVTSATSNNLVRMNMADCTLHGQQTTAAVASYSINIAPNNQFAIITYAASTAPRMYNITNATPILMPAFNRTAIASIAYDSCISPDSSVVYVGYANGNVTAINATNGSIIWNTNPAMTELNNTGYAFPVNGLSCDDERVYVAHSQVNYPTGIINQGFVESLWSVNGSRAWINSKTDTVYDGMDVNNIKCDLAYCYAVKATTPAPYTGVVGSAIVQINKTSGNVTWLNWRSWLPVGYGGSYGINGVHSSLQTLWIDQNSTHGFIYPVYTNGWVQKVSKTDNNAKTIELDLWIRGLTNYWNYISDVPKNIWLSNETPYFKFRHWNQQGLSLNTSSDKLVGTFFRYSMLNTFNSFTAYEYTVSNVLGNSLFIDPVLQVAVTQRNEVQYFNGTYHASCPNTRYSPGLFGWHYQDRACHYEEISANRSDFNIGTTINGTFITGVVYSLVKTKFWDNYPITKYYGSDNWAWASWYNGSTNQTLGFATKFGNDQEDVYSDNYGRGVLFTNYGTAYYYRPQFRADLNRKTDNYIFFKPQGGTFNGSDYLWGNIDTETQKIAYPVTIHLSEQESGLYTIGAYTYGRRITFTAQEPNLFNRNDEPVEIIFNASAGIRSDCQDIIITDSSDIPISLWQVDNSTSCLQNNNVSVWIMMNWTKNEVKSLRLYYNSTTATPVPLGITDLVVVNVSGSCVTNNLEINVTSLNWYNWSRPAAATVANEKTNFAFNTTTNMWASATHYQVAQCYKNSNTTITGTGAAADTCGTAAAPISRCLQTGGTGKIFAKLNATVAVGALTNRNASASLLNVEYYFFANTGRIRVRTQLNQSLPVLNTTVSKNWPPYYYFSINSFIPAFGTNSWLYYSGLYEQMKKPVATFNADMTEANLSSSPLPLLFTIKYDGINNISQANGSILRPSELTGEYWNKGCTAHKEWQYYIYSGGNSYGTAAAPLYTSEFISCSKDVVNLLPEMGAPGYVNVIPEMAWDGTSVNRWYDPSLIGKFYMQPNLYRPYNRENRFLAPYAVTNPYALLARISSYVIPVCPEKEYGYKGYDDFLVDLPYLLADTDNHIKENTQNIPCATQVITFTDQRGSDGTHLIFARNLSVVVGETMSPAWTYPFNTFSSETYSYQPNAELDLTFAQKSSTTAGYYGKYYFTYTPHNYVIHAFATSGNPQFMTVPATAASYNVRYNFAPESYYTKHVFDETALWEKESQNFTDYRNPCWLGRYNNIYGSTQNGHPTLATLSTPGWQHPTWGGGYTCARNSYNMEIQDIFRPGWSSIYPTAAGAGAYNEMVVDGRKNFNGTGVPPDGIDTYYVSRHNSLMDYKHNDDFNSVFENTNDLNQEEKHPNKQPWYCQISRHTNRSFCVMTGSTSSLIYNYNPGGGLTASQPWSPYWTGVSELSTFRNYFVPRYFDASAWLFPYDHLLELNLYPTLGRSETIMTNLLYTSDNPDDYELFFQKQSPQALESLRQNKFLLQDWRDSAFMILDRDSRTYSPGSQMNISGVAIKDGEYLSEKTFSIGLYSNNENSSPTSFIPGNMIIQNNSVYSADGYFSVSFDLPTTMNSGLYYLMFNYTEGANSIIDTTEVLMTNLIASITNDKAAYEQGQTVYTNPIIITDSLTGELTDPDVIQVQYFDPNNVVIGCAKYPSTAVIPSCDNTLTRTDVGTYQYEVSLGSNSLGVYTVLATVTSSGISADYSTQFVVALIDPCKPNSAYSYALSYPMSYNLTTDTLTIIGNSTFGSNSNPNNPITLEQMYEFAQATKGTCIISKPATGTYAISSQIVIGNGTQEVSVLSKGQSVSFSSTTMPQLKVTKHAKISFGSIVNDIPQEGSSIKFTSQLENDILLDIAGGELALYDSYVSDVGNFWGRFMYRGTCGLIDEETSDSDSSIIITKTIFDRAARGQFFFTNNVSIDDMKINRMYSNQSDNYGIVSGCSLPVLNNLQMYHQEEQGGAIIVNENSPSNTDVILQNSYLGYNNIDAIASKDGRGIKLVNTEWDRTYGFNWTGEWSGTTTIEESYGYRPTFVDMSSNGILDLRMILIDEQGNAQIIQESDEDGKVPEQYVKTWQAKKTESSETVNSFNPYTLYAKKYGMKFISEPKTFATRTAETKQVLNNPFITKSEAQASALQNIVYNQPQQIAYGSEYHEVSGNSEQLEHYPVDQCQYFALFANSSKLSNGINYTINYETGQITLLNDLSGYRLYPVYYYGGNITLSNGFSILNAFSIGDMYDYLQYQTSQNNLTEDLYTVDGLTYQFCVDLILGNETTRASLSDSDALVTFKDGYDLEFDGLGGFVDLAGITAAGGATGGLPLNIFNDIGISYAPGNNVYLFSTVMNSQGNLVDPIVTISIYYPNGSLFTSGSSIQKSLGRLEYSFSLPANAPLGTWLANVDAVYSTTEVHDNLAFTVANTIVGGESTSTNNPLIQIDAPASIDTQTDFSIAAFTKNANGLLVNCDSAPLLTIKDLINDTIVINEISMDNNGAGQYDYTTQLDYQSTFLVLVSCSIASTVYTSNPKIVSTQFVNVDQGNTTSEVNTNHPTFELYASTPIATSTVTSLGALVKSSTGVLIQCDSLPTVTIRGYDGDFSTSGVMDSLGIGMYNYTWVTPSFPSMYYVNASCSISGISYTGFTIISTQSVGTNISTNYDTLASYVWNYTYRNLTYYNQSAAENIQSCLRDSQCPSWWINTTLVSIANTINTINGTSQEIKNNTELLLNYFNCTLPNQVCTNLQNIILNVTDIQTRVQYLNTSQIPLLHESINNMYADTQFIRTNMATISAVTEINSSIQWIYDNIVTKTIFDTKISEVNAQLSEINTTTQYIHSTINCSVPEYSLLCTYLDTINSSTNSMNLAMVTYSQMSEIGANVSWIINNMVTQSVFEDNLNDLQSKMVIINSTVSDTDNYLRTTIVNNLQTINSTIITLIDETQNNNHGINNELSLLNNNITWLIQNVATSQGLEGNFSNLIARINDINSTVGEIKESVDCENSVNSLLCNYLDSINATTLLIQNDMATQVYLEQVAQNISTIQDTMATYSLVQEVYNATQWLQNNMATQEMVASNFTNILLQLNDMNVTLEEADNHLTTIDNRLSSIGSNLSSIDNSLSSINNSLVTLYGNLSEKIDIVQANISWIMEVITTSDEMQDSFTEIIQRINDVNTSLANANTLLYNDVTSMLASMNESIIETEEHLYTNITDRLTGITLSSQDLYDYLIANVSTQTDLSIITNKVDELQSDILFIRNNMFYQGNATGSKLIDYHSTIYVEIGSLAELVVNIRDIFAQSQNISSAECYILKNNTALTLASTTIANNRVYSSWVPSSQYSSGDYMWSCIIDNISIQSPFFVSNPNNEMINSLYNQMVSEFRISSLSAGSPRYPNEEALVEAVFTSGNGSIAIPDQISLKIFDKNGNLWSSNSKSDFEQLSNGIWRFKKSIEANPTTGMYSIQLQASKGEVIDAKSVQFRIATGGPYKVYLDCPSTYVLDSTLLCRLTLQDEGEAATESTTAVWIDIDADYTIDNHEPQMSFSKRTIPFQNVTEYITLTSSNLVINTSFIVRASTSYANSQHPNSNASDYITVVSAPINNTPINNTPINNSSTIPITPGSSAEVVENPVIGGQIVPLDNNNRNPFSEISLGTSPLNGMIIRKVPHLFDVMVQIPNEFQTIDKGGYVLSEISLFNLGTDEILDAVLQYRVIDKNGNIIVYEEETAAVYTRLQLIRKVFLPKNMPQGNYQFRVDVFYYNLTASGSDSFEVTEPNSFGANNHGVSNIILGIFCTVFSIILFIILVIVKKNQCYLKSRNNPSIQNRARCKKPFFILIILLIIGTGIIGYAIFSFMIFDPEAVAQKDQETIISSSKIVDSIKLNNYIDSKNGIPVLPTIETPLSSQKTNINLNGVKAVEDLSWNSLFKKIVYLFIIAVIILLLFNGLHLRGTITFGSGESTRPTTGRIEFTPKKQIAQRDENEVWQIQELGLEDVTKERNDTPKNSLFRFIVPLEKEDEFTRKETVKDTISDFVAKIKPKQNGSFRSSNLSDSNPVLQKRMTQKANNDEQLSSKKSNTFFTSNNKTEFVRPTIQSDEYITPKSFKESSTSHASILCIDDDIKRLEKHGFKIRKAEAQNTTNISHGSKPVNHSKESSIFKPKGNFSSASSSPSSPSSSSPSFFSPKSSPVIDTKVTAVPKKRVPPQRNVFQKSLRGIIGFVNKVVEKYKDTETEVTNSGLFFNRKNSNQKKGNGITNTVSQNPTMPLEVYSSTKASTISVANAQVTKNDSISITPSSSNQSVHNEINLAKNSNPPGAQTALNPTSATSKDSKDKELDIFEITKNNVNAITNLHNLNHLNEKVIPTKVITPKRIEKDLHKKSVRNLLLRVDPIKGPISEEKDDFFSKNIPFLKQNNKNGNFNKDEHGSKKQSADTIKRKKVLRELTEAFNG